jgi:methylase of polypeptide subunit release factors
VDILGHIFEQSITDLEEMQREAAGLVEESKKKTPTKRKMEGAFYTPEFITRYIGEQTLGAVAAERFEAYRVSSQTAAKAPVKPLFDDPRVYDLTVLSGKQKDALHEFWSGWINELQTIRVCDPSCGSGAFLIEAFDQFAKLYRDAQQHTFDLGTGFRFELPRHILTHNLFGMDLNDEAVQIARLSCWIKTAEKGKTLTTLDENIKQGNSIVAEPGPLAAWRDRFPDAFADGGFDCVIGNPPYVRQEWIKDDKPFLQMHYKAFDGVADLYVYFYELGLNILKPGGRLGFIVTNKWMKAGYGEALRKLYGDEMWVEQVVDFGHAKQIFPDADVFPCILVARKPDEKKVPAEPRVCVIPRGQLRIDDLSRQIVDEGVTVPRTRFGPEPWNLEPPGVAKLMEKIKSRGVPLIDYCGAKTYRGVTTGFNEAFVIDDITKNKLLSEDKRSEKILKKYIRGQNIDRWHTEWNGEWMIFAKRGININEFPAIKKHLMYYKSQLEPKPNDLHDKMRKGRKPGQYEWYEIQDSTEYWREFEKPKLMYGEITWFSAWCYDTSSLFSNNTVYFIPKPDIWLLAVVNSNIIWWNSWRTAVHGKDEALRYIGSFVQSIPIANPNSKTREFTETAVHRLIELTSISQAGRRDVLDWLKVEFEIEKPTQRLVNLASLDAESFTTEVKKIRGKNSSLSVAAVKRLRETHAESVVPLQTLAREAASLEQKVSDLVNEAYGLTPDDIKLMWETAPPRMPIPSPFPA